MYIRMWMHIYIKGKERNTHVHKNVNAYICAKEENTEWLVFEVNYVSKVISYAMVKSCPMVIALKAVVKPSSSMSIKVEMSSWQLHVLMANAGCSGLLWKLIKINLSVNCLHPVTLFKKASNSVKIIKHII